MRKKNVFYDRNNDSLEEIQKTTLSNGNKKKVTRIIWYVLGIAALYFMTLFLSYSLIVNHSIDSSSESLSRVTHERDVLRERVDELEKQLNLLPVSDQSPINSSVSSTPPVKLSQKNKENKENKENKGNIKSISAHKPNTVNNDTQNKQKKTEQSDNTSKTNGNSDQKINKTDTSDKTKSTEHVIQQPTKINEDINQKINKVVPGTSSNTKTN